VDSLTGHKVLAGTLAYMAPEQLEYGEATIASDIYSLGLVMFEMVTGRRPFAHASPFVEALHRLREVAPSPRVLNPKIVREWDAAIASCLRLIPSERPDDVRRVAEAIMPPQNRPSTVIVGSPGLARRDGV